MTNNYLEQRPQVADEYESRPSPVSSIELRRAAGQFATGVTIISALDRNAQPYGMTASSFCSLSLDPPLIQWSLSTDSYSYPIFADAGYFAVNVLAANQKDISRNFCKPIDRFATTSTVHGLEGLPLIEGCLAWLECKLEKRVQGGDHTIFIGKVLRARVFNGEPLLHWQGAYLLSEPCREGNGFRQG